MVTFYSILRNTLQVRNAEQLSHFYVDKLGMRVLQSGMKQGRQTVFLGYNDEVPNKQQNVTLELVTINDISNSVTKEPKGYWKIGIALPDVSAAVSLLRNKSIAVSEPAQFEDVGFLCHLQDSEGFTIELLQHTFEKNFKSVPIQYNHPLGCSKPVVGQVTLRITDPERSLHFYRDVLGMKLLSRQRLDPFGFALYFLAFTDDVVEEDKIDSIDIREWLWQRPYTTLELQHRYNTPKDMTYNIAKNDEIGWRGITITCSNVVEAKQYLSSHNVPTSAEPHTDTDVPWQITATDPDGYHIYIMQA